MPIQDFENSLISHDSLKYCQIKMQYDHTMSNNPSSITDFCQMVSVPLTGWHNNKHSLFNGFTLVILGALYSLLFGASLGSVLKTVPWPIIVYFYNCDLDGELSHWHSYHIFLYLWVHMLICLASFTYLIHVESL